MYSIIFDFDGTLFRTETVDITAFNNTLNDMGRESLSAEVILSSIGKPLRILAKDYLKTSNSMEINKFCRLAIQYELALIPEYAKLYPHCIELLKKLYNLDCQLAICSNGTNEYINAILNKFCIRGLFKAIWHKKYGFSKKRALAKVAGILGTTNNIIVVGDRGEDINAARKNKMLSIGVLHGFGDKEELKFADYLAKDLKDVYGKIGGIVYG